jgi:arylsulfatase A-like enzyme
VPAIFWAPGEVPQGRREAGLCQLFDVGPTLLEWAGAPLPPACQAQSLMPALRGEAWAGRDMVFAEQAGDISLTGARLFSMARDTHYKAVHILDSDDGQLFDLQADPGEMHNLWDDPAHQHERQRLMQALLDWRMRSSIETMGLMSDAR